MAGVAVSFRLCLRLSAFRREGCGSLENQGGRGCQPPRLQRHAWGPSVTRGCTLTVGSQTLDGTREGKGMEERGLAPLTHKVATAFFLRHPRGAKKEVMRRAVQHVLGWPNIDGEEDQSRPRGSNCSVISMVCPQCVKSFLGCRPRSSGDTDLQPPL